MITDKMTVLSMYPDAVAECFHDPDGRVVWAIWSMSKNTSMTANKCRYILGTGRKKAQAWHQASVGVENVRELMEEICSS